MAQSNVVQITTKVTVQADALFCRRSFGQSNSVRKRAAQNA